MLPKRALVGLSHAIEDECGVRARGDAVRGLPAERYYRSAETRLARPLRPRRCAIVYADFSELREPSGGPAEVPIERSDPIGREWSVICDGKDFTAMLAAWERPGQDDVEDAERDFETIWSAEPGLVRDASLVACSIAERRAAHPSSA